MIKLYEKGVFFNNNEIIEENTALSKDKQRENTIAYSILKQHNQSGDMEKLALRFDAMASHDITYVSIIQSARASGMKEFPLPYTLTNCHNSLCAVGGTINEDDHLFGLSAAKKYGGIYVPAHLAVIHQVMRETAAGGGKMILGSDSHTRYGALGTLSIGEGGGELVKQLLNKTYDINLPEVVGVYLDNSPAPGVGPQDIALAIISAVFNNGYVKNKIMEFVGSGIKNLNVDFRNGIDVMTTETTCLSSIWTTDESVREYLAVHGRESDYKHLAPGENAYYDGFIYVDMAKIEPMIAMPFHPSNVYPISEVIKNPKDILDVAEKIANEQLGNPLLKFSLKDKVRDGKFIADQGVIAGCAGGTYDNLIECAALLNGKNIGSDAFALSVYPSSQPVFSRLVEDGSISKMMTAGATVRSAFCGPCFGAGDVPSNNAFSIRHATRNFPFREGSKPGDGQLAAVALMDARSIIATALNGGVLTPATELNFNFEKPEYSYNKEIYSNRVYNGYKNPAKDAELVFGPNITNWPSFGSLPENLLLSVASVINDPVTTTDELIPSGETSSYRSNPLKLAEFTLSRKDPDYTNRSKKALAAENARLGGNSDIYKEQFDQIKAFVPDANLNNTGMGSVVYAVKPGDGSAREQAASCQRVLGGRANIAKEYATKRYRSNLINWGIVPFLFDEMPSGFEVNDFIFVEDLKNAVENRVGSVKAYVLSASKVREITLNIAPMTDAESEILSAGCLINYYARQNG